MRCVQGVCRGLPPLPPFSSRVFDNSDVARTILRLRSVSYSIGWDRTLKAQQDPMFWEHFLEEERERENRTDEEEEE